MRLAVVAVAMALMCASSAVAQTGNAVATDWLRNYGQAFSARGPSDESVSSIAARLSGARVIGLGEATHGTHEDQAVKAEIIRALVRAGAIDVLALESSRASGVDFDRYVQGGDGDLHGVIRSPSFYRVWQGDEFADLIAWLRDWNRDHPDDAVRVFGVDIQDGARDAELPLAFLAEHRPEDAIRFRTTLAPLLSPDGFRYPRVAGWIAGSQAAEVGAAKAAAAALLDTLEQGRSHWSSDPAYADALYGARLLLQNIDAFELEVADADPTALPPDYITRRDRYMAANLLSQLRPGERAVLWAHDLHVWAELPPEAVQAGFATVGSTLSDTLGDDYRAVGFAWTTAEVLARPLTGAPGEVQSGGPDEVIPLRNDRPSDLGSIFAQAFSNSAVAGAWVDLRARPPTEAMDAWMARPFWRGWAGAMLDPTKWQTGEIGDFPVPTGIGFDILIWHRHMTPAHRWPAAAQGSQP